MNIVVQQIAETLQAKTVRILKLTGENRKALEVASFGVTDPPSRVPFLIAHDKGLVHSIARQQSVVIVEDDVPRFATLLEVDVSDRYQELNVIVGPMERPWGVIACVASHAIRFDHSDVRFIETVAGLMWQAIERIHEEERFRALVRASSQIVWTRDSIGAAVDDSPTWRSFTGQSFDEYKGFGWLNAIHPDDRPTIQERWQFAVANAAAISTEYRLRHRDGTWRWTAARIVPLVGQFGVVRGWVGMNQDVTQEKQQAMELQISEKRFGTPSKTQPLALLMWVLTASGSR